MLPFICFIFFGCEAGLDKKKIVMIAQKEATRFEYPAENMDMMISHNSMPWAIVSQKNGREVQFEGKDKLLKTDYYAVYYFYFPRQGRIIFHYSICVFIDARNGDVITTYEG